jgi:hypothetical protein
MKTNIVTLVVILSFGIEACSSTYVLTTVPQETPSFTTQYRSFDELMAKGHGETFTIVMTDGNRVHGTLVQADSASIAWTDVTSRSFRKVPTFLVHHLELSRNYVWEGGITGVLLGTVPLLVTGSWEPSQPGGPHSISYFGRYLTVFGGVLCGFVGASVGSAIRPTDIFEVVPVAVQSKTKSDSTK